MGRAAQAVTLNARCNTARHRTEAGPGAATFRDRAPEPILPGMVPEPDDASLMLRYAAGEAAAFEVLYRRHRAPLYRYFLRQLRNPEESAELFQEVWARIIRARQSYRPAARFTTYMYQVAHNALVDHLRRQGRRLEDPAADPPEPDLVADELHAGPEAAVLGAQRVARLRLALAALPAVQREAFLLREEGGLALSEIAQVTGAELETVKSRLRYAIRKLRSALGEVAP